MHLLESGMLSMVLGDTSFGSDVVAQLFPQLPFDAFLVIDEEVEEKMSKTLLCDGFAIRTRMALAGSCPVDEPERVQEVIEKAVMMFGADKIYFVTDVNTSFKEVEDNR